MFNYTQMDESQVQYVTVARVSELPAGERLFVEIGSQPVVIFNLGGRYYAIADLCPHDDGPVGDGVVSGEQVSCPRHGARFDLVTGKALALPAVVDIPAYPVRVAGDLLQIGVPRA
jgi:3-phenylpropionate/trans-cinnamate dioxygenase ferredoxin subunit